MVMGSGKRSSGIARIRGKEERKPPLIFRVDTLRPIVSEIMGELSTRWILQKEINCKKNFVDLKSNLARLSNERQYF